MSFNLLTMHNISEMTAAALDKAADDVHKVNTVSNFVFHIGDDVWTSASTFEYSRKPSPLPSFLLKSMIWAHVESLSLSRREGLQPSSWSMPRLHNPRLWHVVRDAIIWTELCWLLRLSGRICVENDGTAQILPISEVFLHLGNESLGQKSCYRIFYHFLAIRFHFGPQYLDVYRSEFHNPYWKSEFMNWLVLQNPDNINCKSTDFMIICIFNASFS